MKSKMKISDLENRIGIKFHKEDLIKEALTHRSYINEKPNWRLPHNERLEYLGDAVLELAVTEKLFNKFPKEAEGKLTVLRAALVNYQMLAKVAEEISLKDFILMSKGESKDGGKARDVILANAIEALIGAIYLDQGFSVASHFINVFIVKHLNEILENESYRDPKSKLQEITQEKFKVTPTYKVLDEVGPAHDRVFKVGVYFDKKLAAEGSGTSKQEAETEAATRALEQF